MKKVTIARFLTCGAAIFAAFGLAACGAESGQGSEAEGVGSSEQALGSTSPVVAAAGTIAGLDSDVDQGTGGTQTADNRIFAASCTVTSGAKTIMLVFGGYKANGTALDEILAFDPSVGTTGQWTKLSTVNAGYHLTHARGDLRAIQIASDKCAVVGGSSTHLGNALADVDTVQITGTGPYTFTIASKTALNEPRANFALSKCGSQLIAIGGNDANLATPEKSSIEVADALAPTSWALHNSGTEDLNVKRFDFGFAKDPNADRYIVAGGNPSTGATTNSIELITTSTVNNVTCVPTVTQVASTLPNAVQGNVVFPQGATDVFVAAGGKTATPSVPTVMDTLTVTAWTGTPAVTVTNLTPMVLNPGTYLPTLVQVNASPLAHEILGGNNGLASYATFTTNGVQQYENGQTSLHFANLNVGRYGAVAELVGGKVYYATGASAAAGVDTLLASVERVTP